MELIFGNLKIKICKKDIEEAFEFVNNRIKKIKSTLSYKKKHIFSICIVDDRESYIYSYGKVKCSLEELNNILEDPFTYYKCKLSDIFESKYVVEEFYDLNGYEEDTPDIAEFDIIIQ